MTDIEELWKHAKTDEDTILVNSHLISQATYVCSSCGRVIEMDTSCSVCVKTSEISNGH